MKNKIISQREARRLRKRIAEIEEQNWQRYSRWNRSFPGGTLMQSLSLGEGPSATLNAVKRLGFVMVAKIDGNQLHIYAVKP